MQFRRILKELDWGVLANVFLIIIIGLVLIASATRVTSSEGTDILGLAKNQLLWVFTGLLLMFGIMYIPYDDFPRYAKFLYIFNLIMLGAVLFAGREALGAQRWIKIGPFSLQPSEFAKDIITITLANYLSTRQGQIEKIGDFIRVFIHIGIPMILILKQPDLGTSLVFLAITFAELYVAGANRKLLFSLFGGGFALAVGWIALHLYFPQIWIPLKDYQLNRLIIFLDPWKDVQGAGYHVIQSQIAIGSGGFWGKGLFQGSQNQLNFLPEQHTDFIFSVLGEELGFIGASVLLVLFLTLFWQLIRIGQQAKDVLGILLVAGVVAKLAFHMFINIGMTSGIMPVTGIPLPFVSYGGSAMWSNLISIGIVLNVYLRRKKLTF
ncbi:rod shape-determining protein RodA [Carboxydothermus pertinax]|uniref:Peptidoglycan glycosyltransferase RodA n=1 Tax=Carboxydothermus pertinax TaxID=870242 RepID=A0A1L8CRY5_9THEO|nr:rod shape-determining protein RodA [Carboxydothermus pertinax]GAV21680.1 rod shape-determining protein RodA [Carboxydothermus pertinax]